MIDSATPVVVGAVRVVSGRRRVPKGMPLACSRLPGAIRAPNRTVIHGRGLVESLI
jgi:hypothetical protein